MQLKLSPIIKSDPEKANEKKYVHEFNNVKIFSHSSWFLKMGKRTSPNVCSFKEIDEKS